MSELRKASSRDLQRFVPFKDSQRQWAKQPALGSLQSLLGLGHSRKLSPAKCSNLPSSSRGVSKAEVLCTSLSAPAGQLSSEEGPCADVCDAGTDCSWTSSSPDKQSAPLLNGPSVPSAGCQQLPLCAGAATGRHSLQRACSAQLQKLKRLSCSALRPAQEARTTLSPRLQLLTVQSAKLSIVALATKCSRTPRQHNSSLPPLSFSSRGSPQKQKKQRRATSFAATGRENIRVLLGPNAVCGSITRYKMLLLAEKVHEAHLQTVLSQTVEQVDWLGEPLAWQEDFSLISNRYAQRVRQCLFWWGGALTRLSWGRADAPAAAGARNAVQQGGREQAQEQQQEQGGTQSQEEECSTFDADADDGELAGAQVAVLVAAGKEVL